MNREQVPRRLVALPSISRLMHCGQSRGEREAIDPNLVGIGERLRVQQSEPGQGRT
jgi:hypothetical protein